MERHVPKLVSCRPLSADDDSVARVLSPGHMLFVRGDHAMNRHTMATFSAGKVTTAVRTRANPT
ncbi:MAG: hypothetical protein FWD57_12415, partial [Polyangiaceae bacterium]|nr:hypothetical protein [Polyangiaceae bacterium]